MDYDRIIAVSNDKTVYHHGDKRIKAYALKEGFVYALEEALKTAKVLNKTQLRVPPIYSVTANEKGVECVGEFIEGETLLSILKQDLTNYKSVIDEFLLLHKEIHSYKKVLSDDEGCDNQSLDSRFANDVLCHGKYALENVIKDKQGNLHVIDWVNAFEGNKEKDCMITYFLCLYSLGQPVADYYLEGYCKLNSTSEAEVRKEESFALRYLVKNFKGSKNSFFTSLLNK